MNNLKIFAFYFLSFTWGVIMSLIGAIVALVLLAMGYQPKRFHYLIYFEVGNGWGGVSLGCFFFVQNGASVSTLRHESGHALQNVMLGVFMPFVIAIPSVVRCAYRRYMQHKGQGYRLSPYESVWFESWASYLGKKYFE